MYSVLFSLSRTVKCKLFVQKKICITEELFLLVQKEKILHRRISFFFVPGKYNRYFCIKRKKESAFQIEKPNLPFLKKIYILDDKNKFCSKRTKLLFRRIIKMGKCLIFCPLNLHKMCLNGAVTCRKWMTHLWWEHTRKRSLFPAPTRKGVPFYDQSLH